jgi:hypothetical protein
MADLQVQSPVLGLNGLLPDNLIDDRAAGDGTSNVDFENGEVATPPGFTKLSCSSPLIASEILGICRYTEVSGNKNTVAASGTKIFKHNISNSAWDELTGGVLNGDMFYPVSFASILHQDPINTTEFQHLLICDGGKSNILKWSGVNGTLSKLLGGTGYYLGSDDGHRALQVVAYQNRAILISPQYQDASGVWIPNSSRIQWPVQACLEKQYNAGTGLWDTCAWDSTTTGTGAIDLIDTGDINSLASLLGGTLIIYQNHSIWQLRYVGGETVFTPDILIPETGLLSSRLHISTGNAHYFVGNDYNIYAYTGGVMLNDIGQPIADMFKRDLSPEMVYRCFMAVGARNKYLWLFFVTGSNNYVTKAYKYNLMTQAWTVRNFSHLYDTASGVTASALIGAGVYTVGQSYEDAVTENKSYGDALCSGTKITLAETVANTVWSGSGKIMTGTSSKWKTAGVNLVSVHDIVKVISGTHAVAGFYRVKSITSDTVMELDESIETGGTASGVDYEIYKNDGDTYEDVIREVRVDAKLTLGDSDGYIFQEDETLTEDDGTEGAHYYYTKVFDGGYPDINKRIGGIAVDAKGETITVEYKIDNGSWTRCDYIALLINGNVTLYTIILTSSYKTYRRFINKTGKRIQFRFSGIYNLRSYQIFDIQPEGTR